MTTQARRWDNLAANAVYAARYGVCEPENTGDDIWAGIAHDLGRRYGETLTADEVRTEMGAVPAIEMTNAALLDWIEREVQAQIGGGDFWGVMHEVHRGVPLRQAAQQYVAKSHTAR